MISEKILKEVIDDLAENYSKDDESILKSIIDDTVVDALSISNRENTEKNITLLKVEIKDSVKIRYLNRGVEHNKSLSANGESSTYNDAYEKLRNNIIKNGKRLCF